MDLKETITTDSEVRDLEASPTLPALPTLPPAPVLPSAPAFDVVPPPVMTLPPLRPNPAAHAPYGTMPAKPRAGEPSPATLRAAEQRRAMKKRRRIRRVATLVVAIAVAALAGPPAVRWIGDGLDKAGSNETESPLPADDAD